MKSKYSDEKHKFTVFSEHRIIASAWQAPWVAIPAKSSFCFYDALVNHYSACFVIIRHKFITISYRFLLLGTCHFVIRHKPIIIRHLFIIIKYQFIIIRHNFSYQAPIYYQAQAKFSETGILHHPFSKVPWGGALCGKLRESLLQVDFFLLPLTHLTLCNHSHYSKEKPVKGGRGRHNMSTLLLGSLFFSGQGCNNSECWKFH